MDAGSPGNGVTDSYRLTCASPCFYLHFHIKNFEKMGIRRYMNILTIEDIEGEECAFQV